MTFTNFLKLQKISIRELGIACNIPYATLYNNIEKPETMKMVRGYLFINAR